MVAAFAAPFERAGIAVAAPSPTLADDSDDAFVLRSISGDSTAFVTLVERYKRAVYSLAYRLLGYLTDAE